MVQTLPLTEMLQRVDLEGRNLGLIPKLEAHEGAGTLHRAVSVLIFDGKGRLLIQQRAANCYHFAGRWANSCCTHPMSDEQPVEGANRALFRELGLTASLSEQFAFVYESRDPLSGLIEREYDHVFVGTTSREPNLNPEHCQSYRWISAKDLALEMNDLPEKFAPWLEEILSEAANRPVPSGQLEAFASVWRSPSAQP